MWRITSRQGRPTSHHTNSICAASSFPMKVKNCWKDSLVRFFFFFNNPATPEIYPFSLHDAFPIWARVRFLPATAGASPAARRAGQRAAAEIVPVRAGLRERHPTGGGALHGSGEHFQFGHGRILPGERFHRVD